MMDGFPMQRRLLISGHVQGVFYRASTQMKARELGLAGWVRNLDDGRVEVLVVGPEEPVQALIAWCKDGPDRARVDDVDVRPAVGEIRCDGFDILRT